MAKLLRFPIRGQFTVETADGKKENYSIIGYSYTFDDGKYNAKIGGGKIIQITTGADGKVSSVAFDLNNSNLGFPG